MLDTLSCGPAGDGSVRLAMVGTLPKTDLWLIQLDHQPEETDLNIISNAELDRANRFARPLDRSRYLRAHCVLRKTLSHYTGIPPRALQFTHGPHGKPTLINAGDCHFNLSHSGGLALIGISRLTNIGVDIEVHHHVSDLDTVADIVLTHGERLELLHTPLTQQSRAFLTGWTRKEACMKALGLGLSTPPNTLDVGLQGVYLALPCTDTPFGNFLHVASATNESGYVASVAQAWPTSTA